MIVKEMKISGCRVTLRYPENSEPNSLASLQSLLETIAVNRIKDMPMYIEQLNSMKKDRLSQRLSKGLKSEGNMILTLI